MDEWNRLMQESLNGDLYQMTAGGPRKKNGDLRIKVRPVIIRKELLFQMERFRGNQAFHQNLSGQELAEELRKAMEDFRQLDIQTRTFSAVVLMSKKGKMTIRRSVSVPENRKRELDHNRTKKYLLKEGIPIPFLVELGVQTPDGKVVRHRYDKFRQINRFLEFIEDVVPCLPEDRELRIIDFGCGKSYLTFAIYYYLHELCGRKVHITGLDLKTDVIENCSRLAEKFGYDGLEFLQGDIADYTGTDRVDMVVTLHACDTATDYALARAVDWDARVILSVPCCQHEMNRQISCRELEPALKYGLIRERMSALLTDALRANLLEERATKPRSWNL